MHPHNIPHGAGRKYEEGAKYWMSEDGAKVLPRDISSHEAPKGYLRVIAISETELGADNEALPDATEVMDAMDLPGSAISFDQGHKPASKSRAPVSMPNAMDHVSTVMVEARDQKIDEHGEKVVEPSPEPAQEPEPVEDATPADLSELAATPKSKAVPKSKKKAVRRGKAADDVSGLTG